MSGVRFELRDAVATVTLDRPRAMNAIDPPMVAELRRIVARASEDPAIRVLVVAGGERVFSAGADLKHLERVLGDSDAYAAWNRELNALMLELEEAPLPTLAVVRGYALAGGLELLLACDLALAAEDATIGDQHANFGLMPGAGGTQRLPRAVGLQRARELLYTGRWLTGAEAAEIGLVLRAVPAARLEEEAAELAATLAARSKRGIGAIKGAVARGAALPMRDAIEEERRALFEYLLDSPSPAAGLQAFRDGTTPVFPE